jgi:Na+-transporting methylmalonyl-CoA/oxaloacetate decarboxylase gamma subunit
MFSGASIWDSVIVSLIAFTIVFAVLAGLSAMIYATRFFAMIIEKREPEKKTELPVAVPVSQAADSGVKDMKKVVAVISAVINASAGRSMNVISVTPVQGNCSNMNQMWRAAGIADCMASRFGSGTRSQ